MRKLIVSEFVSLDGVIQAPGGENEDRDGGFEHGGWTMPYWHDDIGNAFDALLQDVDAFLLRTLDARTTRPPPAKQGRRTGHHFVSNRRLTEVSINCRFWVSTEGLKVAQGARNAPERPYQDWRTWPYHRRLGLQRTERTAVLRDAGRCLPPLCRDLHRSLRGVRSMFGSNFPSTKSGTVIRCFGIHARC